FTLVIQECHRYTLIAVTYRSHAMSDPLIDLEWWVCPSGYRLTDLWSVDPRLKNSAANPNAQVIIRNGPERVSYRPLDQWNDLYLVFSNVRTADQLLRFIEQYGELLPGNSAWGDFVEQGLKNAQFFRDLVQCKERPRALASRLNSEDLKDHLPLA